MTDDLFSQAQQEFWRVRKEQGQRQVDGGKIDAGTRGTVTGGSHMDFFADVITDIFSSEGINSEFIHVGRKLSVPGFFRPLKEWDVVVSNGIELGAVIELKSQVGSFGNNYNNRAEEFIGIAKDIRVAFTNGQLGSEQPFVGYLMVIQDCDASSKSVPTKPKFFTVDPELEHLSYADRYQKLFIRLVREQLLDAACLIPAVQGTDPLIEVEPEAGAEKFIASVTARAHYLSLRPGWT